MLPPQTLARARARGFLNEQLAREAIGAAKMGWSGETPLWFYILREADVRGNGNRLGPVGARIVGDVLVGLLDLDLSSVRHAPVGWQPRASLIELLTNFQHAVHEDRQ